MIHSRFIMGVCMLGLIALVSVGAASVPTVITHQGRLLGSDNQPVADGNYVLIYGLFTQADGGVAVWTETQNVSTNGGLFRLNQKLILVLVLVLGK